jgi:hypothetical protein
VSRLRREQLRVAPRVLPLSPPTSSTTGLRWIRGRRLRRLRGIRWRWVWRTRQLRRSRRGLRRRSRRGLRRRASCRRWRGAAWRLAVPELRREQLRLSARVLPVQGSSRACLWRTRLRRTRLRPRCLLCIRHLQFSLVAKRSGRMCGADSHAMRVIAGYGGFGPPGGGFGGHVPEGGRPGDWPCPECGINNFASRHECFKCHVARPAAGHGYGLAGGGGHGSRPGDWWCHDCQVNNFATRDACFRCQKAKPAGLPVRYDDRAALASTTCTIHTCSLSGTG